MHRKRPLRDRCLNPYRITPIHWLMARRRLWRNHVVSSYWRTRHPLLRFLCLHEAVTLPFVVAIFWPNLSSAIIHRGEVPWSFAAVNRRAKTHIVSALSAWGFRIQVTWFTGPRNARFARISVSTLGLIHNPPLSAWGLWEGILHFSPSRIEHLRGPSWDRGLSWGHDLGFGCRARGDGEWADRPRLFSPFLSWARARKFASRILAWFSVS